jgi:hypothetical protein
MKSKVTKEFRELLRHLPIEVRRHAYSAYRQFKHDPQYPGLHFKQVGDNPPVYSARVGIGYRALGVRRGGDTILWFWIGTHAEYDKIIARW